jgi:hypothetical protein
LPNRSCFLLGIFLSLLTAGAPAHGQATDAPLRLPLGRSTPAPSPIPPETASRTPEGFTIRAFRAPEPVRVDGRLDEHFYQTVPAVSDFVQQEPIEGAPATEKTDVWIFFDDDTLYVAARCWDSQPDRQIVNEMRRDSQGIIQNESLTVIFDTFDDKRNGVFFQTNPLGAQRDVAITDESSQNQDWNTVWDVKTQRSDQGWTVEYAIPFKSLRYDSDPVQVWGVNIRRTIRWKNEWTYLAPVPAHLATRAIWLVSLGATLVGVETPKSGLNLELKPYGISGVRTDLKADPPFVNNVNRSWGADVKYGVSKGLTLDLTYNTDFAQVEDDTQQVNLTRFNQFFPERRDFFLEGIGIFSFGGSGGGNTPVLFFSRRIGLSNERAVPIAGGARVTGRVGDYSIGLLNIQSREDEPSASPATNFSVVRVKRDLLRRSTVGFLYTQRTETRAGGPPAGQTFGVDGRYSLSPSLNVDGYYALTRKGDTPAEGNTSYLGRFDYSADKYGFQIERLRVGEGFNPEVGFLRREDFARSFASARFSPRPARHHMQAVRRFVYAGSLQYIENHEGRLDFREQDAAFEIEFSNSDGLSVDYARTYEFIPKPYDITTGVTVPVGGYSYENVFMAYGLGTQRPLSGTISYQQGSLYGGTKRAVGLGGGRMEITPQFALEPSLSFNWVDIPAGRFTTSVLTERTTLTLTPRMFVSALTQYNSTSRTFSTNARFRWEYRPGSEMFVVYSDGRDTRLRGFPPVVNRAFVVKINKLFRL